MNYAALIKIFFLLQWPYSQASFTLTQVYQDPASTLLPLPDTVPEGIASAAACSLLCMSWSNCKVFDYADSQCRPLGGGFQLVPSHVTFLPTQGFYVDHELTSGSEYMVVLSRDLE